MVSALIGYQLNANNLTDTLAKLQKTATVSRDAAYYRANIGKVTTVEQFLGDYKLYSYAMKAYGLEDQIDAKALMKKVLQSDLTDTASFANQLNDTRYKTFAAAFDFNSATVKPVAQGTQQTQAVVEAYSEARVNGGVAAASAEAYFTANIGKVTSVDQLIADPKLYNFAMTSAGLDPKAYQQDYVRSWLTGAVQDNTSTSADDKFARLGASFNFETDGSVQTGKTAADAGKQSQMIYDYYVNTGNTGSAPFAASEDAYYKSKIGSVQTALDITGDRRLYNYVMTTYGFDASSEDPSFLQTVLAAGPADTNSVLKSLATNPKSDSYQADLSRKAKFTAIVKAFNFQLSDQADSNGVKIAVVPDGESAQTDDQLAKTSAAYFNNYQTFPNKDDATMTSTFKFLLGNINTVTDLLADQKTWGHDALNYVLKGFGIPPVDSSAAPTNNKDLPSGERTSLLTIRKVLTSDPSDPNSFVGKLKDPRFTKLAAAFNFGADGKPEAQQLVQSSSQQTATGTLYQQSFGTNPSQAKQDLLKAETKSYLTEVAGITSLKDLLANKKVINYALTAYGLDKENLSTDKIKKILTSDLGDPKSYANSLNDKRYITFAQAFNITPAGTISVSGSTGIQNGGNERTTENNYLLQTLEEQAGDQNEGSRLALYFLRKAPDIKSSVSILADRALTQVIQVALGLPSSFSNLDISTQTKYLDSKLTLTDFKDPAKLDKFIKRFAGLYDVQNSDTTLSDSPLLQLLGSSNNGILGLF